MMCTDTHLVIAQNMTFAQDRLSQAEEKGLILHRKARLEALTHHGVLIRVMSFDGEFRGHRPQTYQLIHIDDPLDHVVHKIRQAGSYLEMCNSMKVEFI